MPLDTASKRDNIRDVTQLSFLALVGTLALASGGCSHTSAPTAAQTKAARTLVKSLTGNASSARNKARTLRSQSDSLLVAKDYNGAMDKRLQILDAPPATSFLGALSFYAIQSLALDNLASIASHLDAPACRKYAAQLQAIDARQPSYADQLQRKKADELKDITLYTKDLQKWQQAIPQLGLKAHDQQILAQTPVSQIKANISALYDAEIKNATAPYSSKPPFVAYDPYTVNFARPSGPGRFLWAKAKTERVLIVAALQDRADRLDKRPLTSLLPPDPFGNGPLKRKGDVVYSAGPDTKDDEGRSIPSSNRLSPSDKGDILAPTF